MLGNGAKTECNQGLRSEQKAYLRLLWLVPLRSKLSPLLDLKMDVLDICNCCGP